MNSENDEKKEALQEFDTSAAETSEEVVDVVEEVAETPAEEVVEEVAETTAEEAVKEVATDEVSAPNTKPRKFPTWVDFFATVGVFILSVLVGSLLSVVLMRVRGVESLTPDITFIYYLVQMLPTIAFVVWLRHRAGRGNAIHLGFSRVNLPMLLWGVVLVVVSGIVLEPLLVLFPTEAYDSVQQTIGLGGWAILSTIVAAPILEEILFRGLIFESCAERFGRGVGLLLSALLFGVIHVVPVQVINAFVVGLILGYVYLRTRSLVSVVIIHAINNGIAYATMAIFGDVDNVTLRDVIAADWLYWTVYGLSALLFVWAMWRMLRLLRDNTELN